MKYKIFKLLLTIFVVIFYSCNTVVEKRNEAKEIEEPVAKEWIEVVVLEGTGNSDTKSFYIKGDKVKITATTSHKTSGSSYSSVSLKNANGRKAGTGLSILANGKGHGETIYRNLDSGRYYISVISGVNWKVIVEEYL